MNENYGKLVINVNKSIYRKNYWVWTGKKRVSRKTRLILRKVCWSLVLLWKLIKETFRVRKGRPRWFLLKTWKPIWRVSTSFSWTSSSRAIKCSILPWIPMLWFYFFIKGRTKETGQKRHLIYSLYLVKYIL